MMRDPEEKDKTDSVKSKMKQSQISRKMPEFPFAENNIPRPGSVTKFTLGHNERFQARYLLQ